MGISSSLNAGVSGLNANANKLATISDNIANSQTYGYKRADVDFSSLTVADAKSPNTIGGGRWFTAGGVKTNAIWDVDAKGAIAQTSNSTDLAVTGRGFLPVSTTASIGQNTAAMPFMLTTTGSFQTDAQGYLTTPSGLVLLGWPADANGVVASQPRDTVNGLQPVQVNMSSVAVEPTANIALNVNLPTDDVEAGAAGDPRVVTIEYFDNVGGAQTLTATFAPTVPAVGNPRSNTWTLTLTDQASGQSAGTYELVFSDAPPNAGGLASVTALGGGTLATTYDPVTGEMMLDLGTQQIGFGVGSTGTTGPQHLSQLTSTFSSVGVSHDGSGAGTYTGLSIDERGFSTPPTRAGSPR